MKTTATPHNDAEGFLKALASLKFQPARWDSPNDRQLDLRNKEGHPILRICIGYEGALTTSAWSNWTAPAPN